MALLSNSKLVVFFLEVALFSSFSYSQTTPAFIENATDTTTDNGTLTTQAATDGTAATTVVASAVGSTIIFLTELVFAEPYL